MKRNWSRCVIGFIVLTLLLSMPLLAYKVKGGNGTLNSLAYTVPELRVPETGEASWAIKDMYVSQMGVDKFLSENSGDWVVFVDLRRGVPTLLDGGAIPIIPGVMNTLSWDGFANGGCQSIQCLSKDKVEELAREFLDKYPGLFPVKQEELVLDPNGSVAIGESIYLLRFQWVVDGIPVEGASIYFRINNGNLLQVACSGIAPMDLDTTPTLSVETAWDIINGYLGDAGVTEKDEIVERGKLTIIPVTPKGMDPDVYAGTVGGQAGFVLAYNLKFTRPGEMGTWEAVIDAHTGEILRFVDANRYGRIHGGAKPSDGVPPDEDRPFPYADTGLAAPNNYTDAAGMFPGNNATTTLTGKYAHIDDNCGSISLTTTTGDADFLVDSDSAHTDCDVPTGNAAGAGNTKSSRTLFYNTTAINLKAQTYNPSNTWLTSNYVILHVNSAANCNAGSSGLNIYFYQHIAGSCNNLGEIPGVAMHEWAHSYDTNDGSGGQSPPLETYSDWTAIIQTHNSCTGAGFLIGQNCDGYGDACTDCTGVRDCDYAVHSSNTPWTSTNHTTGTPSPPTTIWGCSSGSYNGPCGWEDHCESGISTQALWDFVYRDLPAQCSMDLTSGWMLEDRLWFAGVSTLTASYSCSSGVTNGCNGGLLYTVMRALDDDGDGTANGTPHAHAIYHALNRHKIDCSTYNDSSPQNANQTSCPSLNTPTLSATGGNNSANLSWTTGGANATRYFIYKNESSCDVAFNRIAIVTAPTLTYTDTACANGVTYYYRVQAVTANDSCTSPSSNCVTVTPQPCTASTILDKSLYACTSTVNVSVLDSTPGSSPWTATAWSTSDATPRSFTLTGTVPNLSGTFTTTTGTGGPGVVHVAAGDTLTVRFVDPDNCGGGSYNANATALIDCTGPVITNVMITNVTATTARVTWTTNEAANSRVTYGTSTPPGTNADNLTSYVTSHTMDLSGLSTCTTYYLSVTSADIPGNSTTDNNGGSYYSFTTQGMAYAYGPFTAESGTTGWTLTNQWHRDTCKAHGGTYAMKAGSTTCPGTYNASTTNDMTMSANITLGAAGHGYHLKYWEYYQTESGYDYCRPQISTDGGTTWTTLGTQYAGTGTTWAQKDFDLAAYTGSTVRIRFEFYTDGSQNYEGWYVDDIEVSKSQGCSAELVYQSRTMTEACNGTGSGGGNAILEPGEDGTVSITMVNSGSVSATGVSATLTSTTTGVTVTTNTANFPNIAMGATGTSLTNYVIHVDPTVTCVTAANFTLHSTSTQNPAGNDSYFTINVGQAGGTITDFSQNFTSVTPPALPTGWTESHTSGNAWLTSASYYCTAANGLYYPYNSSSAANSYVYTPGIALTSGVTYTLNFNQKIQSATWPENFEVKCGTAATPAGQTITILASAQYTNTTCTLRSPTFTVPTTGTYYISWHCTSAADMYYLIIDDITLTHPSTAVCNVCSSSCTNPTQPTISSVTDNNACAQSGVTVTFTAGSPSTSNALVVDGTEVATGITSPYPYNPGNTTSHNYVVRTYNTASCHTDSSITARADANNTPAAPTAGNNGPICAGATLNLTASTISGATYAWTGPNGFTSAIQNPSITNATTAATGTYSVTATVSGCTGAAGTTSATVNAVPAAPTAGNNGPICAGATLNLTASTISGATYAWTGPNGFTSAIQNPSITNATTAATGTYSVTATVSGCTGAAGTTTATVNAVPAAPTAGNNGPICAGATLNLTASTISGATYAWTGPNGFTSAVQNPSITNATTAATGTYSVTATVSGCTGPAGTTTATVNSCTVPPEIATGSSSADAQTWSGQVQSWPSTPTATGYTLWKGLLTNLPNLITTGTDFCDKDMGSLLSQDCTTDDASLVAGRCYYYLVTAYNVGGQGPAGSATAGARVLNTTGTCP